jgi:hypothetical protein
VSRRKINAPDASQAPARGAPPSKTRVSGQTLVKDCEISGGLYFRRIPEDFLTRVILGYKCPFEEKYVLKALEKVGLTSTKVVRARMCLETYSIRFD